MCHQLKRTMSWNWMNCGLLSVLKPISNGSGSPYAGVLAKSSLLSSAAGRPQAAGRYGTKFPMPTRNARRTAIFGKRMKKTFSAQTHQSVGKESGQTAHVERWNNTLRQRLGRYVRKTLSFSKRTPWHHMTTKLFIYQYNLSLAVDS